MMLRTRGGFEKTDVCRENGFEWRGRLVDSIQSRPIRGITL